MKTTEEIFHRAAELLADRESRCSGMYRGGKHDGIRTGFDTPPQEYRFCLVGALGEAAGVDPCCTEGDEEFYAAWAAALGVKPRDDDTPEWSLIRAWDHHPVEHQDLIVAKLAAYHDPVAET